MKKVLLMLGLCVGWLVGATGWEDFMSDSGSDSSDYTIDYPQYSSASESGSESDSSHTSYDAPVFENNGVDKENVGNRSVRFKPEKRVRTFKKPGYTSGIRGIRHAAGKGDRKAAQKLSDQQDHQRRDFYLRPRHQPASMFDHPVIARAYEALAVLESQLLMDGMFVDTELFSDKVSWALYSLLQNNNDAQTLDAIELLKAQIMAYNQDQSDEAKENVRATMNVLRNNLYPYI